MGWSESAYYTWYAGALLTGFRFLVHLKWVTQDGLQSEVAAYIELHVCWGIPAFNMFCSCIGVAIQKNTNITGYLPEQREQWGKTHAPFCHNIETGKCSEKMKVISPSICWNFPITSPKPWKSETQIREHVLYLYVECYSQQQHWGGGAL